MHSLSFRTFPSATNHSLLCPVTNPTSPSSPLNPEKNPKVGLRVAQRRPASARRDLPLVPNKKEEMEGEEYQPPHEPEQVPTTNTGSVRKFCVSPTNGRLEWIQASITQSHLNKGSGLTDSMSDFLLAGDKNPHDKPALIVHQSLGGTGDDVFNVFLEGRSFDRDTFDNEIESTVYYALKDRKDDSAAVVTVKFIFKDSVVTRPYKLAYQVELPNGDIIENELVNV